MPLTDVACRNATCPAGKPRERYSDSLGMYLEVTPTGRKYWRLKYRFGPKEKRLALGIYPEVSLAAARRARDKAREYLSEGQDLSPLARKRSSFANYPRVEPKELPELLRSLASWRCTTVHPIRVRHSS